MISRISKRPVSPVIRRDSMSRHFMSTIENESNVQYASEKFAKTTSINIYCFIKEWQMVLVLLSAIYASTGLKGKRICLSTCNPSTFHVRIVGKYVGNYFVVWRNQTTNLLCNLIQNWKPSLLYFSLLNYMYLLYRPVLENTDDD